MTSTDLYTKDLQRAEATFKKKKVQISSTSHGADTVRMHLSRERDRNVEYPSLCQFAHRHSPALRSICVASVVSRGSEKNTSRVFSVWADLEDLHVMWADWENRNPLSTLLLC
ncbi:hypothetical protein BaRGS_00033341 [Batillaria attramentaria]|uniref:Uncharacterized protein n=1 Tax=Batillaria attramentaria TaxID=370345 RepID=A0ABD0JKB3_9CAEN